MHIRYVVRRASNVCREGAPLWMCNFQMQLIGTSLQEGEPEAAIACARTGLEQAQQMGNAPLQVSHGYRSRITLNSVGLNRIESGRQLLNASGTVRARSI